MKKSTIAMIVSLAAALVLLGKAFVMGEEIRMYLLVFFAIGNGLALLRLFVNNSIKKMKGKNWKVKVAFFTVLLGLGLPFQSWFRNAVLFNMDSAYLLGSISIMVLGMVFMTFFFGFMKKKLASGGTLKTQTIEKSTAR